MEECVKRITSLIVQRDSAGMIPQSPAADDLSVLMERSSRGNLTDNQADTETPTSRRIARLEKYGEPPPLSPLVLNTPVRLKRSFHPPIKSKSSKTCDGR